MQRNQLFKPNIAPIVLSIINDLLNQEHREVSTHFTQLKNTYGRLFATEILEGVLLSIDALRSKEKQLQEKPLRFSARKTLKDNVTLLELEHKIQQYQHLQRIMIEVLSGSDKKILFIDL